MAEHAGEQEREEPRSVVALTTEIVTRLRDQEQHRHG